MMKIHALSPSEGIKALGSQYRSFIILKPLECDSCGQPTYAPTYSMVPTPKGLSDLINICDSCKHKYRIN